MDLLEIIPPEKILFYDPGEKHKLEVLQDLMLECIGSEVPSEKSRSGIWAALRDREINMSTGIGLGVAIPHCSSEHINDIRGLMAILKHPIPFESVDDIPVQVVVLLLMPRNRFEKHIKTLATVARLFNDAGFRDNLLRTTTPEEAAGLIRSAAQPGEGNAP